MKWEKVRLEEICEINIGKTPSRNNSAYWGGSNPWVAISDMRGDKFINSTKERITDHAVRESGIKIIPKNTILYSFKLSIGKVAITNEPLYTNEAIASLPIKDNTKVSLEYLYWALQTLKLDGIGDNAVMGVTLNKAKLKELEIPLPPLTVQQNIVDTLDKADALRRKDQELLKKYDELAQAIFIDMFGDPVKNEKGWEVKKLREVCSKIGSGSTPRGGKEAYKKDGIAIIRSLNIHQNEFRYKDLAFIDEQQAQHLRNVIVEENDILFNITGASVCRTTIVPTDVLPARVNQHVSILRPISGRLNPQYFVRLLNNENMNKLLYGIATQGGATREAITKDQLQNLEIIIPPLTLQQSFANKIKLINRLKMSANEEKSEELFQSLLQEVFKE